MEWRFRISGAYLWGDRDATQPLGTATVTPPPGHLQTPTTTFGTGTAEQANVGLGGIFFGDEPPSRFPSHAGGIENENASDAGVVAPTLADKEHGPPPEDGVDLQIIEGLSHRIASLLSEARAKDTRIKDLESDLRAKCSEHLLGQHHGNSLLDEANDATLAELQADLRSERIEHLKARQQVALLLDEAMAKDARLQEMEASIDTNHGGHSKAEYQTASLLDGATAKDARLQELELDLDAKRGEHVKAEQQIALLLDDAKTKDARLKELELDLDAKRGEHVKAEQQVALLLDDAKTKDGRLKELELDLNAKRGEHVKAEQQITSLLDEARAKDVRIEEVESRLASERTERLTVQQLYASLRQTIRVMVRVRPSIPDAKGEGGAARWSAGPGSSTLEIAASAKQNKALKIRFDRVFRPQASNNDVFDEILPLVRQAATEGGRCVVMAYGASSTGKSYTMKGDEKASPPTPGIIQLAGGRLFDMVSSGATVEVSSIYAYNGQVRDLLVAGQERNLDIPATQKACTPAASYEQVRTADELVGHLDSTMSKTVKAATLLNAESSRGHYFFTVRVTGQPGDAGTGLLTFVDLAGHESVKESGVEGDQFTESRSINSDLFALGEMIRNLRQGLTADTKRSKLTQLLAGAMGLGTNATVRSEILMLVTVNLSDEHMPKSLRTLSFAQTAIGTPYKKTKP